VKDAATLSTNALADAHTVAKRRFASAALEQRLPQAVENP